MGRLMGWAGPGCQLTNAGKYVIESQVSVRMLKYSISEARRIMVLCPTGHGAPWQQAISMPCDVAAVECRETVRRPRPLCIGRL